jgi:hypothetical protein
MSGGIIKSMYHETEIKLSDICMNVHIHPLLSICGLNIVITVNIW